MDFQLKKDSQPFPIDLHHSREPTPSTSWKIIPGCQIALAVTLFSTTPQPGSLFRVPTNLQPPPFPYCTFRRLSIPNAESCCLLRVPNPLSRNLRKHPTVIMGLNKNYENQFKRAKKKHFSKPREGLSRDPPLDRKREGRTGSCQSEHEETPQRATRWAASRPFYPKNAEQMPTEKKRSVTVK